MSAFVEIKEAKAAMLIEVKREKKKSSQDLPKRFGMLKENCHFADLWREKNTIRAGGADLPGPAICQRSVRFVDWNF